MYNEYREVRGHGVSTIYRAIPGYRISGMIPRYKNKYRISGIDCNMKPVPIIQKTPLKNKIKKYYV